MDPRIRQLAKNLIHYSVELKPGENIVIQAANAGSFALVEALVDEAYAAGGIPFVRLSDQRISRALLRQATREQLEFGEKQALELTQKSQAYIGFSAIDNKFEMSDVPAEKLKLAGGIGKPSRDWGVKKTKWCVLRAPTLTMAQDAGMPMEEFENFFFQVCLLDYPKMSRVMDYLKTLWDRTDKVKIIGRGSYLEFSMKEIPADKCDGKKNVPDGEVCGAPVRESINGTVYFTAPTIYDCKRFGGVALTFKDGKIITATCQEGSQKDLNEILDRDPGARYIGEFALGINPLIKNPMLNILFDEKITGSFHMAMGQCYDESPNGNDSQIHWDMVCIQTPEYGGGEIYFDGVLIRKAGRFVLPELECLNPENLL